MHLLVWIFINSQVFLLLWIFHCWLADGFFQSFPFFLNLIWFNLVFLFFSILKLIFALGALCGLRLKLGLLIEVWMKNGFQRRVGFFILQLVFVVARFGGFGTLGQTTPPLFELFSIWVAVVPLHHQSPSLCSSSVPSLSELPSVLIKDETSDEEEWINMQERKKKCKRTRIQEFSNESITFVSVCLFLFLSSFTFSKWEGVSQLRADAAVDFSSAVPHPLNAARWGNPESCSGLRKWE